MDEVITLSSDDSDVEIVGSTAGFFSKPDPLPLSDVRVDVDAMNVNVPPRYIDLTDPRWRPPGLKLRTRQNSTGKPVVDLTESDSNGAEQKTKGNLVLGGCPLKVESVDVIQNPDKQDFNSQKASSVDGVVAPKQECGNLKSFQRRLNKAPRRQRRYRAYHKLAVKLPRVPFLETHIADLKMPRCYVSLTKDCTRMSLCFREVNVDSKASDCVNHSRTVTPPQVPHMEPNVVESLIGSGQQEHEFASSPLQDQRSSDCRSPAGSYCSDKGSSFEHSTRGGEWDDFCSPERVPSPTVASLTPHKEVLCANLEQLELNQVESRQSRLSVQSPPPRSPSNRLNSSEPFEPDSLPNTRPATHKFKSEADPPPTSGHVSGENEHEWQLETEPYRDDSPVSFLWQEGSDGEDMDADNRFGMDFRAVSREDRHFVCPVALRKIMSGPAQSLIDEDDEGFGTPEVLCRQSLSLVYSTIDENYTEGTLQLLSDLLQPGYYPPKDITNHLLRGILLDPQCPHHLCVQAFNLLMRTQRLHMANKGNVPWDWELLTSVMANQDNAKRHRCEIVRMLLEYIVQTLEDDFQAKRATSSLHQSIAKTTLSCDQQFPRVREVVKWLFSAIMKSTEHAGSRETTREKDEYNRMVSIFQRMLSLALDVDRSPALNSAKLSQELFHMLVSNVPQRAHRMLLLESLQSKLLRCKLLEHLLDYACPLKVSLPMSLNLLLHFLKNCTLAPDPMDGTERWQKWEELVHLLWMLLLSYNKAMKGYLCSSFPDQRARAGTLVYKPDDKLSKPAVREAVEAFLSRSQADLGQALPFHVEESLTYLQDHLLDVCQC
ncbi:SUMO-interacting motif-containing protein 1 [Mugil cephalus]|uniref:SUMO-interacting motif-containing protein 1 n=1 Tax=Mugil cephalus TaxID=48193 RepID=UPI001FB66688|nr:SUMO-interacting motif-containing protein 1 [Mugil cephalus]